MSKPSPLPPSDPLLRRVCKPIGLRQLHTKKVQTIVEELLDFVYVTNKTSKTAKRKKPRVVGLAANQLGIDLSIAVVDLGVGHKTYNDVYVLINPIIKWSSKTIIERDEGCVNLDHIRGFVKRSRRVKVEAYDRSGNKLSLDLNGWPAILLQHEVGHLNGELFIDRLDNPKKAHLVKNNELPEYKKQKKNWNKFIDVSKLVVTKKV